MHSKVAKSMTMTNLLDVSAAIVCGVGATDAILDLIVVVMIVKRRVV
jgi:hypothetical protein